VDKVIKFILVIFIALTLLNSCNPSDEKSSLKGSFHLYLVYSNDFYNGLKSSKTCEDAVNVFEKYIKNLMTIKDDLKILYNNYKEFFDTLNPEKLPGEYMEFKPYVKKLYDLLPDLAVCIAKFEVEEDFKKEYKKYKDFLKGLE